MSTIRLNVYNPETASTVAFEVGPNIEGCVHVIPDSDLGATIRLDDLEAAVMALRVLTMKRANPNQTVQQRVV